MSAPEYRSCEIELVFADNSYLFRLPAKRIAELQDRCGAGIGAIYKRTMSGDFYENDLKEIVRLGLIGGGLEPLEARKLIDRYCDAWPLNVWFVHAAAILSACVNGYEKPSEGEADDPPGKMTAATDGSGSPRSTAPASTKASRRKKSTT